MTRPSRLPVLTLLVLPALLACTSPPRPSPEALAALERNCEAGVGADCHELATNSFYGRGVRKDLARMAELDAKACGLGHAPACTNYGDHLMTGTGTAKDVAQARVQYERGCDGGEARSCFNLGSSLRNGYGGPVDAVRANTYFVRGCDADYESACTFLAASYFFGTGGYAVDKDRAAALFEKACALGDESACGNAKSARREAAAARAAEDPTPSWSTRMGTLTVGVGDTSVTATDLRSTCNALQVTMALGAVAGPIQACLVGEIPHFVSVAFAGGKVASSEAFPDDEAGRCVVRALGAGPFADAACELEATFNGADAKPSL